MTKKNTKEFRIEEHHHDDDGPNHPSLDTSPRNLEKQKPSFQAAGKFNAPELQED